MIFTKTDFSKYATAAFKKEINKNLKAVYGQGSGVKVNPNTIEYSMISDSDYSTDWEQIKFMMTDGRQFELFFEHKGLSNFIEVK